METREDGAQELVNQTLDSTLESVDEAEAIIMSAAEKAGFDEDDLHKIGMATRECIVNAVVHGNRYSSHKKVHLRVEVSGGVFRVHVRDEGEGFDLSSLPDPVADENILRHSGRGIFLIRAFMDDVEIRPAKPSGTEITLTKKLVSGPGSEVL
jgi:serine/threonine-protein kinase RsbW